MARKIKVSLTPKTGSFSLLTSWIGNTEVINTAGDAGSGSLAVDTKSSTVSVEAHGKAKATFELTLSCQEHPEKKVTMTLNGKGFYEDSTLRC